MTKIKTVRHGLYARDRMLGIRHLYNIQNANEKNLITGTRYFNAELMLTYFQGMPPYTPI
ncbi:MAG: hypothetical protein K6G27_14665 [Lachnospiraceae bacterium]|nr:hypothetical protein [Lachnospiraceae bacterium]